MSEVAILGGTFNPVHKGHLHLAHCCADQMGFSRVVLLPTAVPPHKEAHQLLSNDQRLELCRLAVMDDPLLEVSDLEMRLESPSYTYRTLRYLKQHYPEDSFNWIMGGDMLLSFDRWVRYQEILQNAKIVAAAREDGEYEKMCRYRHEVFQDSPRVNVIRVDVLKISSTQIRQAIANHQTWEQWVPEKAARYIQDAHCYENGREGSL